MTSTVRDVAGLNAKTDFREESAASAAHLLSGIERKFCEHGLTHLKVNLVSSEYCDPIQAQIVDPNGCVVLSISVDRATGSVCEFY